MQVTQGKLDLVEQELASMRLNESALEANLKANTSNEKRDLPTTIDSLKDDKLITRVKKRLKNIERLYQNYVLQV
ncbi:unnamed protein product [Amaranthus hypochondriacus]